MGYVGGLFLAMIFLLPAGQARGYTLENTVSFLQREPSATLEDWIQSLPETLKSQYVLMRESRSRQRASAQFPRVIFYERNFGENTAPFFAAFSGESADPRYGDLELIQFRPETASWEFREIHFSAFGSRVSAPNPPACLRCHGPDPRPLWEMYPEWPGAVGSGDSLKKDELAFLEDFAVSGARHARYRFLNRRQNLVQSSGFLKSPAFVGVEAALREASYERTVDRLKKTPDFDRFKYALLGSFYACPDIAEFIPVEVNLGGRARWEALRKAVRGDLARSTLPSPVRLAEFTERPVDLAVDLRFLMSSRGVELDGLGSSFRVPHLLSTTEGPQLAIGQKLQRSDPDLRPFTIEYRTLLRHVSYRKQMDASDRAEMEKFCLILADKSRRRLAGN